MCLEREERENMINYIINENGSTEGERRSDTKLCIALDQVRRMVFIKMRV